MRLLALHIAVAITLFAVLTPGSPPAQPQSAPSVADAVSIASARQPIAPAPTIALSELDRSEPEVRLLPMAYQRVKRLTVREAPSPSSRIVFRTSDEDGVGRRFLVTDGTPEFLRVSSEDAMSSPDHVEGWVAWGDVISDSSALVVDLDSGATVARLPMPFDATSVRYSHDGTHAVISSLESYCGDTLAGGDAVIEVRTSDYSITRVIRSPRTSPSGQKIAAAYYDPKTDALRIGLLVPDSLTSGAFVVSDVAPTGDLFEPSSILSGVVAVATSGNAEVALALGASRDPRESATFHVIDLTKLEVRNTFVLEGDYATWSPEELRLTYDGSELVGLFNDTVVRFDTYTGNVLAPLSVPSKHNAYVWLSGSSGSLSVNRDTYDEEAGTNTEAVRFWLTERGLRRIDSRVTLSYAQDRMRVGTNPAGTRLYTLDASGNVIATLHIDRPELRGGDAEYLDVTPMGLAASPEGRRAVVLLGIEDG